MSSDSAAGLRAVSGTFVALSVLTTGARFYARLQSKMSLGADDWIMVVATTSFITATGCLLAIVHLGQLGYPSSHLSLPEQLGTIKPFQQLLLAWSTFLTLCLACTKMSILFFYKRIFCVSGRRSTFHALTIGTIVVVICWLITFELLGWLQCGSHVSALWDGNYLKYCSISFPYLYGLAVSDFLLDIWILGLPFPQILRLHTTPAKKAAIGGVFLLAFVGLGASIARMVEYIKIEIGGVGGVFSTDKERSLTISAYLAMLEAGMSLVAANLPSLWLLFTKTVPEKVLQSVSSVLSLRSLRRSNEKFRDGHESDSEGLRHASSPSHVTETRKNDFVPADKVPIPSRDQSLAK